MRAGTSVALNIAEGSTGQSNAEQARCLGFALRSLIETVACQHLIRRRNYLEDLTPLDEAYRQSEKLSRKLFAMRKAIGNPKATIDDRREEQDRPQTIDEKRKLFIVVRLSSTVGLSFVHRPRSIVGFPLCPSSTVHRPVFPMPETSIIIRTFNEQKYLPDLLKTIQEQTYRNFELIVVDSGSLDRTREIAEEYCDKIIRVRRQDFTFGHSLNVGIQHSTSPFIAIVSAHTKPIGESWLARLIEPLRGDRSAMVFGRQMGWGSSKFSEIQDFERTFSLGRETRKPPHFSVNNANSAIRRDLWERRGFDEVLPGLEDIEWAKHWVERGFEVIYEPEAAIFHIHEETWPQVQRRYYRKGVAARRIGIRVGKGFHMI